MNQPEKLKIIERESFDEVKAEVANQFDVPILAEKVFLKQAELFEIVEKYLSQKTKEKVLVKINIERKTIMQIMANEAKVAKAMNRPPEILDEKYFTKKSLNINFL